jgi:hypothetical protein
MYLQDSFQPDKKTQQLLVEVPLDMAVSRRWIPLHWRNKLSLHFYQQMSFGIQDKCLNGPKQIDDLKEECLT